MPVSYTHLTVVQCCDALHIEVVGWLIQDQDICTGDHHLGKKTADFLTTGKNTYTFDILT